jgi:hypothetical protein
MLFSIHFFFNLHSGEWSRNWVHSACRPFIGLLYLPRMIVRMENLVEWMAGETEVLGENLPRRHFVRHKSHLTRTGIDTRAAAVGSQRLTASAMARPIQYNTYIYLQCYVTYIDLLFLKCSTHTTNELPFGAHSCIPLPFFGVYLRK